MYFTAIIILIMFTDTLWIRNIAVNRFYIIIGLGLVAFLIGIDHCSKKSLSILCVFSIPVLLTMFVNLDFNTLIFFKIALLFICWLVILKSNIEQLINSYINFIVFISVFSLVCMLFRQIITAMDFIPTINSGSYGTKALFFTNIKIGTGNLYFLRNQGPFWEPGAFQAYLNIALMFLLFGNIERKHRNYDIFIIIIAVLSTISTTGYFVFGIIVLAKMFIRDNSSLKSKMIITAVLIAIVLVAINNEAINYLLFDKMSSSSNNKISHATRLYSIIQNGKGILLNPFFGIAPEKYAALFTDSTSFLGAVSTGVNTTTSLSVWALYGVLYFLIFNCGLIYFAKSLGNKLIPTVFLLCAVLIIYNTENMNYSLFFTLIPIWGCYTRGGALFENCNHNNSL